MIRVTDQYLWNFVFLVFFIVLVVMGAIIVETESRISPENLTWSDFAVVALATYRLTKFVVSDNVTKFWREQFYDAKKVKGGVILEKPATGPRKTLADIFTNEPVSGLFAGALLVFLYLITSYAYYPVLFLAIAGLATLISEFSGFKNKP
jgi:hypothetical protein